MLISSRAALVATFIVVAAAHLASFGESTGTGGAATETLRAQSPGGAREGISVRGEWTILIRNEDGSIASRHEFRNAFVPSLGGQLLSNLLKSVSIVTEWMISMQGGPCVNASGQPSNCILVQDPNWQSRGPELFPTLTTAAPTSGPNAGKFVLTGSARAARATGITTVTTFGLECPSPTPGSTCSGLSAPQRTFTHHVFTGSNIINVVQGQTIDVTVVISFS
jgi:hypothetical protein